MSTNVKNNQEKKNIILEVKDLRISFRTNEGVVKAVRGVSYDLEEGETLAIVGESGSGKSVSSRSIMGILAGNAIIDGGSIIYEGQDLLKLHEDEFHKIRGNKIGMIFQDPTSSLNPIMRVGKQIEEGMLVNGKRKKNKYRDLIQKEHQDYVNAKYDLHDYKTNYNFKKKQKDDIRRYKLEIKQINANQSISRAQKDELIAENRVIIEQIRTRQPILTAEERKEKLVEVKQRLKTTKSELKVVKAKAKLEIRE